MKNIMIMGFLALMSGHVSADNKQEVNAAEEKVLTAQEVVDVEKNSNQEVEVKELPKKEKSLEIPVIATETKS
jgi:hypothetical protein